METSTNPAAARKGFFAQMPATLLLTIACCAFYPFRADNYSFACSYDSVFAEHRWWTAVTALFAHGSIGHLLTNMLFLFLFGRGLELKTGPWMLLCIFIVGGAISMLLSSLYYGHNIPSIGASGAISAILATLMLFNPWRFTILLGLFPMPIGVAGFTFLLLNIGGFIKDSNQVVTAGTHTSYLGHLAGFLAGIFFGILLSPGWRKNLFLSIIQFIVFYVLLWLILPYFGIKMKLF